MELLSCCPNCEDLNLRCKQYVNLLLRLIESDQVIFAVPVDVPGKIDGSVRRGDFNVPSDLNA